MKATRRRATFDQKRERLIAAATTLIIERGFSGLTMRDVAEQVGLTPATLAYYFDGKTGLAAAVFARRLESLEQLVAEAARQATALTRAERLLTLELERLVRVKLGQEDALASLPNANETTGFDEIYARIEAILKAIERFFLGAEGRDDDLAAAQANMFIGVLFFLPTWVHQYPLSEIPRVRAKILEFLETGMGQPDSRWQPEVFAIDEPSPAEAGLMRADFLRAATRLLNVSGYAGTSVDRIAEELNVTKGAFYHHVESKDDLVIECIRSNFRRISSAINRAKAVGGDQHQQLGSAIATILDIQFEGQWPLLRSTAFASLPQVLKEEVALRSNRMALRFASSLIDGIAEGSVRPVDPIITSHIINSTLYAGFGLQDWAARMARDRAIAIYASTLTRGLSPRPA